MKKDKIDLFLEELSETPIVSVVCKRVGLSRQTVYRWCAEDRDFKQRFDEAISRGVDSINDLSESKLIANINDRKERSIEFWLRNNKFKYRQPKPPFYGDIAHSELDKLHDAITELIKYKREEVQPEAEQRIMANYSWYEDLTNDDNLRMVMGSMEKEELEELPEKLPRLIEEVEMGKRKADKIKNPQEYKQNEADEES